MGRQSHFRAYAALAAVCVFWGTTYLAIRMALESFAPATLVGIRYLISGSILCVGARLFGIALPRGRELWLTALYGVIVIGLGNGALVYAEEWVPSGLASIFITTGPFWMTGLEAVLPGGERLRRATIVGMLVGLAGTVVLVSRGALDYHQSTAALWAGFLLLQFGCAGWATGSILQRRLATKAHPVVSGAVQQLATGIVFCVLALIVPGHPIHWSQRGVGAIVWLVVFGSIVGYSSFIYSMDRLAVSVVSIYNYVNPVVAVALGWLFYREPFGDREAIGMVIIFAGVAIVKRYGGVRARGDTRAVPAAASSQRQPAV
ncbi:MAG TPA: EamA family transporter [Bryobacteraceae bacterium]|nr:EamA family transporter [Bryobacteraceae bacterium]